MVAPAASEDIADAVAAPEETTVAPVANSPCRHAYRGTYYLGLCHCYDLHVPASPSMTVPSPEACGQGMAARFIGFAFWAPFAPVQSRNNQS